MTRKTKFFPVETAGRDQGKLFLLTEMSALAAERWAQRAFLVLARSGVDVPDDIETMGFVGWASFGMKAFARSYFEEVQPLLDEMLGCIQVVPDPGRREVTRACVADDDFEEVLTIAQLRREVLDLHVDFSVVASLLKSRQATRTVENISNIETSPGSLES